MPDPQLPGIFIVKSPALEIFNKMNSKYMKETTEAEQPLKNWKAAFRLIKNENWQPPQRKPKKRIRPVIDENLPPAA
jgi:hypothetical protein